jgi:hypothetical protein
MNSLWVHRTKRAVEFPLVGLKPPSWLSWTHNRVIAKKTT